MTAEGFIIGPRKVVVIGGKMRHKSWSDVDIVHGGGWCRDIKDEIHSLPSTGLLLSRKVNKLSISYLIVRA